MKRLTSPRGWRARADGFRWHEGYDVSGDNEPIRALLPGTVVTLKRDGGPPRGYGNLVVVRVDDAFCPPGYALYTGYGHLAALPPLQVGDRVTLDTIIGRPGTTSDGRYPNMGAHIHIAGRRGDGAHDPFRTKEYANSDFNLERLVAGVRGVRYLGFTPANTAAQDVMDRPWVRPPGHSHRGPIPHAPERGGPSGRGAPHDFRTRKGELVPVIPKHGESQAAAYKRVRSSARWRAEAGDAEAGAPAWMVEMEGVTRVPGPSSGPQAPSPAPEGGVQLPPAGPLPQQVPDLSGVLSGLGQRAAGGLDSLISALGNLLERPAEASPERPTPPTTPNPTPPPPPEDLGLPRPGEAEPTSAPAPTEPAPPAPTPQESRADIPRSEPATTAETGDWRTLTRELLRDLASRGPVLQLLAADPDLVLAQGEAETGGDITNVTVEAGGASVGVFGLFSRTWNGLLRDRDRLPARWAGQAVPVGDWNNVSAWQSAQAPWRPAGAQVAVFGLFLISFDRWVSRGWRLAQQWAGTSEDTRSIATWLNSGAPQPALGALLRLYCKASSYRGVASMISRGTWRRPVDRYMAAYHRIHGTGGGSTTRT